MILENLALATGSIAVECLANFARFFGSLFVGLVLASASMWACRRVGHLFNLAYRPRLGDLLMAFLSACCILVGIVALTAVTYARSLVSDAFNTGRTGSQTVTKHSPEACRAIRSALPFLNLEVTKNLILDCDSPGWFETLRAELGPMFEHIHAVLQRRLQLDQFLIVAVMLGSLGICLSIPIWRAYRSLAVHVVGKYSRL